jgi:hypothetical protein
MGRALQQDPAADGRPASRPQAVETGKRFSSWTVAENDELNYINYLK